LHVHEVPYVGLLLRVALFGEVVVVVSTFELLDVLLEFLQDLSVLFFVIAGE
jgi:hypothetical protein